MPYNTTFSVADGASPLAQEVAILGPEKTAKVMLRPLQELFRNRFQELQQTRPNKLKAPRQGFWENCGRSTTATAASDAVRIVVNAVGLRLLVKGGTVVPKGVSKLTGKKLQYLTIPTALGYGKRASEVHVKPERVGGRLGLVLDTPDAETNPQVYFWLVRRVVNHGDNTILPSKEAVRSAGAEALRKYTQLQVRRAQAAQAKKL